MCVLEKLRLIRRDSSPLPYAFTKFYSFLISIFYFGGLVSRATSAKYAALLFTRDATSLLPLCVRGWTGVRTQM